MNHDRSQCNELMNLASDGDSEAFGQLAGGVQDDIYRFALAQGLHGADAAECVQETLLRAFQSLKKWKQGSDAMSWLYGIAINVAREYRRRRRHYDCFLDSDILAAVADGSRPSPDADMLARLNLAIGKLPARQREAVACRFLRRMSVAETAAVMGCAEGTVKATINAAVLNLKETLRRLK